ncbi:plasmid stabilization protein [Thiospirochaeta perfilievii]|uniref:Plasmid stabilization protein n=1 Tax=Thiospirochaeta perfilievii TaxID=252967 RepID=A0A5C1Q8X7_9SPIO|nr:plasmid stabilization protein [Thiospirochaeta perfilievii]QEN04553.1 plasmid stabilization protein [Thiospirochaeta perfilievii]
MPKLIFTNSYEKRAKKFLKKHPEMKSQYKKTLQILEINPSHPSLKLHQLQGNLSDLHSVSINISYRITLELLITDDAITLVNVGTHNEVYGK